MRPRNGGRIRAWLRGLPDSAFVGRSVAERMLILWLKEGRPVPQLRAFLRAVDLQMELRYDARRKMRSGRVRAGRELSEEEILRRFAEED